MQSGARQPERRGHAAESGHRRGAVTRVRLWPWEPRARRSLLHSGVGAWWSQRKQSDGKRRWGQTAKRRRVNGNWGNDTILARSLAMKRWGEKSPCRAGLGCRGAVTQDERSVTLS